MKQGGRFFCVGFTIIFYALFLVLGASRQGVLGYISWSGYFCLRFLCFSIAVYSLLSLFSSGKDLYSVNRLKESYPFGDPLLAVRAMFCFMVLMQHGFGITFAPVGVKKIIWENATWILLPGAWVGVWGFFVLSGYVIGKGFFFGSYPLSYKGLIGFYRNRLLKIYPGYLFILLAGSYFLEPSIFDRKNLWMLVSMGLFDYDGNYPLNPVGSLWSIATEIQFYLIAPFLAYFIVLTYQRLKLRPIAGVWFILTLFVILLLYRTISFIDGGFYWKTAVMTPVIGNIDLFFSGMILAYVIQKSSLNINKMWLGVFVCVTLYILSAFVVCSILDGKDWLWAFGYFGPTVTGLTVLLIITSFEGSNRNNIQSNPLRWIMNKFSCLGLLSYEVYLFHDPVRRLLRRYMPAEISIQQSLTGLSLSIAITYFLAFYSVKMHSYLFAKYRYERSQ